jgi:hypothetical protein
VPQIAQFSWRKLLVETIHSLSRKLFFVGRLQLLASILYSVQVSWTGIFILAKKIIKTIEQNSIGSYRMGMRKVQQKQKWLESCVFQKRKDNETYMECICKS